MMLPSLRQGPAPDLVSVYVDGVRYWFSFETCIAFRIAGEDQVLSENVWTAKTGRHLNLIESVGASRLPHTEFLAALAGLELRRPLEQAREVDPALSATLGRLRGGIEL